MNQDVLNPPTAWGEALFSAILKQQASDFRVDEILAIDLAGEGDQLYLCIEKTSMNTDEVVSCLQSAFAVEQVDIGLCGLKDRHSVSRQWFSVKSEKSADVFEDAIEQFNGTQRQAQSEQSGYCKQMKLISHARHQRKLRRGAHSGNAFVITLRNVCALSTSEDLTRLVDERLHKLIEGGFPAYIGAQRFGHGGQNVQRAQQWFAKPRKRTSRTQRSLWLSAARSALFNLACAARVRDGSWNQLREGEPAVLDGTRSYFLPGSDTSDQLEARLASFDIHSSAPWWGRGRSPAKGECAAYEQPLLDSYADLCAGLEKAGLACERRALRAKVGNLRHQWLEKDVFELSFTLASGVFATTLLRELCVATEPAR